MAYFFLAPLLPELELFVVPDITFDELMFHLKANLSNPDLVLLSHLQEAFDIENLRNFWLDKPFILRGNFDEKEVEEIILRAMNSSSFLSDFLEKYTTTEERVRHFDRLLGAFYKERRKDKNPFLVRYFDYEYQMRLLLGSLRAKTARRDLSEELKEEDNEDSLVQFLVRQKDSPTLEVPSDHEKLKNLYDAYLKKPYELYREILFLKWRFYEDAALFAPFSIDAILAYVVRFFLVEKSLELDSEVGKMRLVTIL